MLFHDPGGVPDDFRSGGKGMTCDERPAADHGIISNRRALQDSRPVTDPNMIPDAYASGRINPFSFRVQHGVTVPGSDGHVLRKDALFANVHAGGFVAGDNAGPARIGLSANGDSAAVADPDLKPVHGTVIGNLDHIVISGEMKSAVLYPGPFANG